MASLPLEIRPPSSLFHVPLFQQASKSCLCCNGGINCCLHKIFLFLPFVAIPLPKRFLCIPLGRKVESMKLKTQICYLPFFSFWQFYKSSSHDQNNGRINHGPKKEEVPFRDFQQQTRTPKGRRRDDGIPFVEPENPKEPLLQKPPLPRLLES